MRLPLIYIAGPYSSDPVNNTREAVLFADALYETGLCVPFVPHLSIVWDLVTPEARPVEFWYELDLHFLERCDALIRLPGRSTGADREVTRARELKIRTYFVPSDEVTKPLLHWIDNLKEKSVNNPVDVQLHLIQIMTDKNEHWVCTCKGWEIISHTQFNDEEYLAARASHAAHQAEAHVRGVRIDEARRSS